MPQARSLASAAFGVLTALLLASCASETIWDSKPEPPPPPAANAGITGGVLGGAIGTNLDERDRQRAFAAEMQALEQGEPGEPVGWRGMGPKHYGTVIPGAPYQLRGIRCRDYTHAIYVDGKPQTARGTACRNPDGSWTPAG